jgi:hypothetical protein
MAANHQWVKPLPQVLAELRERFPVYRTDSDIWVLSRFDDVKAVQSNPQQFSSRPNPYEGAAPPDDEMKPEVLERLLALAAGIPVDMAEMASAKTANLRSIRFRSVDAINTLRVSAGRFASFEVVSRSQIPRFRSSRRFLGRVRFPAAPLKGR